MIASHRFHGTTSCQMRPALLGRSFTEKRPQRLWPALAMPAELLLQHAEQSQQGRALACKRMDRSKACERGS